MKVILKKDVKKIGRAGDVVDVNEGYANNFLFPNKLATKGTPELIEAAKKIKIEKEDKKKMQHTLLEKTILEFKDHEFNIKKAANEKGTLFSKIHEKDICIIFKKESGIDLEEKSILLKEPLDKIGEYHIAILNEGIKSNIKLKIEKQ
ncbi:MAG: large subunit ribosomal protein [Bacteroidota bacterium]|jgi:large subunit ribosomal protein L9|nr:large subunit ribosomal protein [Bacteroidota bacterium]